MRKRNVKIFMYPQFLGLILTMSTSLLAHAEGNSQHGSEVFTQQCAACHSFKQGKNKIGPSLFAVVGRQAGTIPDYTYSDAIKSSGLSWNAEKLDSYLTNPQAAVPGVKMPYPGLADPAARADLIAYLSTLK